MTLDELLSMSIGDKVINCRNIWILTSIHEHNKDCLIYHFNLASDDTYNFAIQVIHNWNTKTTFIYNHHDTEYYSLLDPFMNATKLYSNENHIEMLKEKNQYHFARIDYNNKCIEKLENE